MYDSNRFRQQVLSIKNDINHIKNSGKYYISNDLKNEFDSIDDGLNHLHMEGNVQDTSQGLKGSIRSQNRSSLAVAETVERAAKTLADYKDIMNMTNFSQKQENQTRELHHWALLSLKDVQKELLPHTYGAWKRMYDFKNDIGVTDLYTGLRHNVSRPREPCEPNSHWTGKPSVRFIETKSAQLRKPTPNYDYCRALSAPAGLLTDSRTGPPVEWTGDLSRSKLGHTLPPKLVTKGYKTIDSLYPRATMDSRLEPPDNFNIQSVENLRLPDYWPSMSKNMRNTWQEMPRSVQQMAGITTTFPGMSEYIDCFTSPTLNRLGGGYVVNPRPNYEIYGRPLVEAKYYTKSSEYQGRYGWPSGDTITKFPWLCK